MANLGDLFGKAFGRPHQDQVTTTVQESYELS